MEVGVKGLLGLAVIGFILVATGYYLANPVVVVENINYSQELNVCFNDSQTKQTYEFWDDAVNQLNADMVK